MPGASDYDEELIIRMQAKFLEPEVPVEGAMYDPIWQEYQLLGVYLIDAEDAEQSLSLLPSDQNPLTIKVVDRAQILFSAKLTDLVGSSFQGLTCLFAEEINGASKKKTDHLLSWETPELTLLTPIEIAKGQKQNFDIDIYWRNTVVREGDVETMGLPELKLSVR